MNKIFLRFGPLLVLLSFLPPSVAETLRSDRPVDVHLRPSNDAPVIGELEPGDELRSPRERVVLGPSQERDGWRAVAYRGDLRGFVPRQSLTKDLEVRTGSPIYHERESSSDLVITEVERDDVVNVGRLSGDWADVRFRKSVPGFIRYEPSSDSEDSDAEELEEPVEEAVFEDEPRQRGEPVRDTGPAITSRSAIPTDGSTRLFQGYLSEPRSFLGRKHPYSYQVVTERGNRIAYLDLSRLLITTPLDTLIHYQFEFFGRAEEIEDRREFVIRVENMRLK